MQLSLSTTDIPNHQALEAYAKEVLHLLVGGKGRRERALILWKEDGEHVRRRAAHRAQVAAAWAFSRLSFGSGPCRVSRAQP